MVYSLLCREDPETTDVCIYVSRKYRTYNILAIFKKNNKFIVWPNVIYFKIRFKILLKLYIKKLRS